jgi:hypothetical protein
MSEEGLAALRALVVEFADIGRVALSDEPPARLPPLVIKLQQGAVPVRVKLLRYTPPQKEFLRVSVSELERNGLVYRNPAASWCAAPVLV